MKGMAGQIAVACPADQTARRAALCAVLFVVFEVLRENEVAALPHLDGAARILEEHSAAWMKDGLGKGLARLLARLDLDASLYLGVRPPVLSVRESLCSWDGDFPNVEDLLDAANELLRRATLFKRTVADDYRYRHAGPVPIRAIFDRDQFLHEYRLLDSRLDRVGGPCGGSNLEERLLIHRIQIKIGLTMMQGCLHREETMYDEMGEKFREIVEASQELLGRSQDKDTFTLERGLIHPLYWTASKSRDGELRRRALDLLRRCPREGVWIAEIQATVAQRVIEIEESGVASFPRGAETGGVGLECHLLPESARVHSADLTFEKEARTVHMTYQTCPTGLDGDFQSRTEALRY
jgi:hypothetical protein